LATVSEPHSWDLCVAHAGRITAPRGWELVRHAGPLPTHPDEDDLVALADNTTPKGNTSPVFVFEGCQQLGLPHSIHDDIVAHGAGRFSHWGEEIQFSSSDNSDPRTNGRTYSLVIAEQ